MEADADAGPHMQQAAIKAAMTAAVDRYMMPLARNGCKILILSFSSLFR